MNRVNKIIDNISIPSPSMLLVLYAAIIPFILILNSSNKVLEFRFSETTIFITAFVLFIISSMCGMFLCRLTPSQIAKANEENIRKYNKVNGNNDVDRMNRSIIDIPIATIFKDDQSHSQKSTLVDHIELRPVYLEIIFIRTIRINYYFNSG